MIVDGDALVKGGSSLWFTGCSHFGHKAIIKLANRPFESLEDMDETLVSNWNRVVREDDMVFHLGDFSWKDPEGYKKKLNGEIIQIRGNHDRDLPWVSVPYVDLRVAKNRLILFHYPIEEWDGWFKGTKHLHCHTHSHDRLTAERRINVTVEANDYTPVALNTILYKY